MTFAKPTPKQESTFDEMQRLMCSVPGCPKRWTVHISGERPKCSEHQWAKDPAEYRRSIADDTDFAYNWMRGRLIFKRLEDSTGSLPASLRRQYRVVPLPCPGYGPKRPSRRRRPAPRRRPVIAGSRRRLGWPRQRYR